MRIELSEEERLKLDHLGQMRLFKEAELWDGGYWDADPLTPVSWSSYTTNGYVSVYHAAYLACILPYIEPSTKVLEIGPGRGAWTNAILGCGAQRLYGLDVQDRETNRIDEVLRDKVDRLTYIVVDDFSGDGVPDEDIDFVWSFGTFVHLSALQQKAYIDMMSRKMKPGARGFVQIADLSTWNRVVSEPSYYVHGWLADRLDEGGRKTVYELMEACRLVVAKEPIAEDYLTNITPAPGRYFFVGLDWFEDQLKGAGLEVVRQSVMPSLRDPIIHFRRPS